MKTESILSPVKEWSKITKVIVGGKIKPKKFDPLEDMIGMVKVKKVVDVEKVLKERGFEIGRKKSRF